MNEKNKKLLFNIGALGDVISAIILLYGSFQNVFKHISVTTSIFLFSIIKLIGKIFQVPYNLDKPNMVIKNVTIITLYTILVIVQSYNIYKHLIAAA